MTPEATTPITADGLLEQVQARMEDLRPMVEEYRKLEAAEQALASANTTTATPTPARRGPGRPRKATPAG